MSFPSVVATTSGNSGSLTTSHDITLPAGSSGDYILLAFVLQGEFSAPSISGFTQLFSQTTGTSSAFRLGVYYKAASTTSTETINVTTGAMAASAYIAYRVSNWNGISYTSAIDSSGTTTPQPPTHNPGTARDYLWVTAGAWNGTGTISGYPYASNQTTAQWNNVDGVAVATSTKQLNASSDSPGSFTVSFSPEWVACTIAIQGSAGGGGPSGSANIIEGADTCAASGQYAGPSTANITERSDSTGLPEGRDYVLASGSYGPYWNAFEFPDTCAAYGAILPESNPNEQADTCAASGFADTPTHEAADTLSASGTVRDQCAITKVWFAGDWVLGIPKVYANGTWENVPGVKIYNGTAWVGCS